MIADKFPFKQKKFYDKLFEKKATDYMDKFILKKRVIIETVNDVLESTCQLDLLIIS